MSSKMIVSPLRVGLPLSLQYRVNSSLSSLVITVSDVSSLGGSLLFALLVSIDLFVTLVFTPLWGVEEPVVVRRFLPLDLGAMVDLFCFFLLGFLRVCYG